MKMDMEDEGKLGRVKKLMEMMKAMHASEDGEEAGSPQLGNGSNPFAGAEDDDMKLLKQKMMEDESMEGSEGDEENESPEYQALEDKMGTEKHEGPTHLFGKKPHEGLKIMIALANARKGNRA